MYAKLLIPNSERGKNAISAFTITDEIFADDKAMEDKIKNIFPFCRDYLGDIEGEHFINGYLLIEGSLLIDGVFPNENERATDYFGRGIDNIEVGWVDFDKDGQPFRPKNECPIVKKRDYKGLCGFIPELSLNLYFYMPRDFTPIFFRERFDVLMRILDVLEIPIPELPTSTNKRGRLMFYNDLCENLSQFAKANDLTSEEVCACIYDFTLMLSEDKPDPELPEPTNIWLVGAHRDDYEPSLKNPAEGAKSVWACNANTKRGDIVIMYVCSPHSFIQSVWRANIDGLYTPFNFYNSRSEVTNGIVVPHITLNELRSDPYFSQLPIVRKNMQGVAGVPFSATDYKELQRLLAAKGFDVSVLPQLYSTDIEFAEVLENEKDVEEKLLIPLLNELGYRETDWTRQLSQKAGRKEKAIPDFVFFPRGETHFQNAPMIIDAKYDMSSALERTKSYNQALSYARMMKSSVFGICDRDRLIIYKERGGTFDRFKPSFEKHWQSLRDGDVFRQLKLLIGREAIRS